jgi:carboxypeptidase C (cathepsin A)
MAKPSYVPQGGDSKQCLSQKQHTSADNAVDIAAFFAILSDAFPQFQGRKLHLTGESFAVRRLLSQHFSHADVMFRDDTFLLLLQLSWTQTHILRTGVWPQ